MADLADSQSADSKLPDTAAAPFPPTSHALKAEDNAPPDPRDIRGARRARWGIALLVALFLITLWQRDTIRAHWWATRLMATDDLAARGQYLSFLATVGDKATGAVWRLARDDRPDVRILAVMSASRLARLTSNRVLATLLMDSDVDVREAAGRTLAFELRSEALNLLSNVARDADSGVAASAVASLSRINDPAVPDWLALAGSHASPKVRAQMIESSTTWLQGIDARLGRSRTEVLNLLIRIAELADDPSEFDGELSLEREISSAESFVRASHPNSGEAATVNGKRTVASVARSKLSALMGRAIIAGDTDSTKARQDLARAILERIETSRLRPSATSLPIDLEKQIGNPQEPSESTP